MNLKQIENSRLIILLSLIFYGCFKNISGNDLEQLSILLNTLSTTSLVLQSTLEKHASDYKKIKLLYDEATKETAKLFNLFELKSATEVFAAYIYLYRKGYLSYNKKFQYSSNMKDFPYLHGVDVIRGKGVCRSISSMFTDVSCQFGLPASNIAVKVSDLKNTTSLSTAMMDFEENNSVINEIFDTLLRYCPIGNHLVTIIDGEGIFDPTNDAFLNMLSKKEYYDICFDETIMKYSYFSNFFGKLSNIFNTNLSIDKSYSTISRKEYIEYYKIYKEILLLLENNKDILEQFYNEHKELYSEINSLCDEQHSLIKRYFPILPIE